MTEFSERIRAILEQGYPFLVAEVGSAVVGYASLARSSAARPTATTPRPPSTSTWVPAGGGGWAARRRVSLVYPLSRA